MIKEGLKPGSEILDYFGQDLIEEFTAFVANSIEKGVDENHEYFSFLKRICPTLAKPDLERIYEACRVEIVNIELDRRHQEESLRLDVLKQMDISRDQFEALRLVVRSSVLEGRDDLSAKKLDLQENQYQLLVDYVNKELARQIEHSRKQLRPKAYEGIGLSGELNEMGFAVREVFLGSDAHVKGIKRGDLIVEVIKDGKSIRIADPGISDQDRVNHIRSANQYKILQNGQVKVVEILKQIQNGIYRTTESITDKIRAEMSSPHRASKPHLIPVVPGRRPFQAAANTPGIH